MSLSKAVQYITHYSYPVRKRASLALPPKTQQLGQISCPVAFRSAGACPGATVTGVFVTGRQMGPRARQVSAICRVFLPVPEPVSGLAKNNSATIPGISPTGTTQRTTRGCTQTHLFSAINEHLFLRAPFSPSLRQRRMTNEYKTPSGEAVLGRLAN